MELAHTSWSCRSDYVQAMRCTTCIGAAVNKSADRLNLPNGGYGFLGVCNDSVAMVQAGMGTAVTQFPCILAGQAKTVVGAAITVRSPYVANACGTVVWTQLLRVARAHCNRAWEAGAMWSHCASRTP